MTNQISRRAFLRGSGAAAVAVAAVKVSVPEPAPKPIVPTPVDKDVEFELTTKGTGYVELADRDLAYYERSIMLDKDAVMNPPRFQMPVRITRSKGWEIVLSDKEKAERAERAKRPPYRDEWDEPAGNYYPYYKVTE